MKSMMNGFNNRRRQSPVAAPSAGSEFRELTREETTAVSGGLAWLAILAFAARVGFSNADHNGPGTGTLRALNLPK